MPVLTRCHAPVPAKHCGRNTRGYSHVPNMRELTECRSCDHWPLSSYLTDWRYNWVINTFLILANDEFQMMNFSDFKLQFHCLIFKLLILNLQERWPMRHTPSRWRTTVEPVRGGLEASSSARYKTWKSRTRAHLWAPLGLLCSLDWEWTASKNKVQTAAPVSKGPHPPFCESFLF